MPTNPPTQPVQTHLTPNPRPYSPTTTNQPPQLQTRSPNASSGSLTQTTTSSSPAVLRLRGAHSPTTQSRPATSRHPRIQWAADVIDNEGLNRKKSKVCCIYHKPRAVGESSDESSSDSGSDSDSDRSDGARPAGKNGKRDHSHRHDGDCAHGGSGSASKRDQDGRERRQPSPNAYEKMPRYDVKPLTEQPGKGS